MPPVMVACEGCGGLIWPESAPRCDACKAKAVDALATEPSGNESGGAPEASAVKRPPRTRAGEKSGKEK